MLNIDARSNAASSKRYYSEDKEYYAGEELAPPEWGGQGAKILKLEGRVNPLHFGRLCDNRYPKATGANAKRKLTPRDHPDRRVLWDMSFHPCKSYSAAVALTNRPELLDAFQRAVRSTMAEAEQMAAVRTRDDKGKVVDRNTGVMTYALWWHGLSRPVNGLPDPHVHCHATVLNHTYDRDKGRFMALQMGPAHSQAPLLQDHFHKQLRHNLHALGYRTHATKTGWELSAVPKSVVKKLSQRHEVMLKRHAKEVEAHEKNPKRRRDGQPFEPPPLHWLGRKTREAKRLDLTREECLDYWQSKLTDRERAAFARLKPEPRRSRAQAWMQQLQRVAEVVMGREQEAGIVR